jgi:hypothetical protein
VKRVAAAVHTLDTIDFFIYSRAAHRTADVDDDPALDEEHWSYMDGFADVQIHDWEFGGRR